MQCTGSVNDAETSLLLFFYVSVFFLGGGRSDVRSLLGYKIEAESYSTCNVHCTWPKNVPVCTLLQHSCERGIFCWHSHHLPVMIKTRIYALSVQPVKCHHLHKPIASQQNEASIWENHSLFEGPQPGICAVEQPEIFHQFNSRLKKKKSREGPCLYLLFAEV